MAQGIIGWWGFKFVQMKGHTFSQGEIITKVLSLKIFFSRTTGPISIKLGTMHSWVKGFQGCLNEQPLNSHNINKVFFLSLWTLWLSPVLIDLYCFLRWAMWPMGLLFQVNPFLSVQIYKMLNKRNKLSDPLCIYHIQMVVQLL